MATWTVNIRYIGLTPVADQLVYNIARHYRPLQSYADSDSFAGTVYDTNRPRHTTPLAVNRDAHPGMAPGGIQGATQNSMPINRIAQAMQPPFDATQIPFPVPLSQFRLATVAEDLAAGVTFVVDNYKEAFFYMQLRVDMEEQGFAITVTENP